MSQCLYSTQGVLICKDSNKQSNTIEHFYNVMSEMVQDQPLYTNQSMGSRNYARMLTLQSDGNLVLYDMTKGVNPPTAKEALWATNTVGTGANKLILQGDGNLVLYSNKGPVWQAKNAFGQKPVGKLILQNDGNLVLYTKNGKAVWSTNTQKPGLQ